MLFMHTAYPLLLLFAVTAVESACNYGVVGLCGQRPFLCPNGSTCRYLIPGASIGMCCLNMPDPRCPPPNMMNICPFNMMSPTYNCMNNNDCTNNQVCCPDPCGGTCKDPAA
ncbi:uncharacterized protein LOC123552267 [Mercenaria mercenaria]|uniref:uncharacterized protein LOC123552267 n=1 Tax=Mercenaria mercenaria TaxID=6596 RepID=UPI00234E6E05|nr:uncharacterized protein LOC123552267 [Mercenaria mercenaria]